MLDPIHNQGLRLALGAFRTSPVASLYVEANEPSLYSRREKLYLQYAIRLAANPSNPAHEVTFPPNNVNLYEQKPKAIKSFGIRISPLLESANIKPQNIEKHFTPNIPAWCMKPPEILFDLHSGKKSESSPHILKDDFRKMQSRYKNYQQIYTDGSKEDSKVGCAVISEGEEHPKCVSCDAPFTVRHFLLECGDFAQVRNNCFHVDNMKELFQDIHNYNIMTFLRQINLFSKI